MVTKVTRSEEEPQVGSSSIPGIGQGPKSYFLLLSHDITQDAASGHSGKPVWEAGQERGQEPGSSKTCFPPGERGRAGVGGKRQFM